MRWTVGSGAMTDHRRRGPEGTLQQQVFRLLRKTASMRAEFIAETLGRDIGVVEKALGYLAGKGKAGKVKHKRPFPQCRVLFWYAIGTTPPTDRRGKPAACRNHHGDAARAKWLKFMQARHGPDWVVPVAPKTNVPTTQRIGVGRIALEQHWAMR